MLRSLFIKHFAIIDEISVDFERGLNILTGETGAGKSIIIDALGLLLGERATSDTVRAGCEKAVVEGIFSVNGNGHIAEILNQNEIEPTPELLLRRELSIKGQSRSFLNDSPISLALLKEIGDALVDLHGQHEHQSLLRAETHREFLDDFGSHERLLQEYRTSYKELTGLIGSKKALQEQESQLKAKKALYEFQVQEIDAVGPKADEETLLEHELNILENSEKLSSSTSSLNQLLYGGEASVHDNLVQVRKQLEVLSGIDGSFSDAVGEARSAEIIVEELAKFVQKYASNIEFNPERLEEIREHLGQISLLKKKYGGTLTAVLQHRKMIGEEVSLADNFEKELAKLETKVESVRSECGNRAQKLSAARKESAQKLEKRIVGALAELGIPKTRFKVSLQQRTADFSPQAVVVPSGTTTAEAFPDGIDVTEFFLTTNVGEDLKPLVKVASGGEVSRIMLALKSSLAQSDKTPLLVFDEIDTGVSGRIGQAVGLSLKKLSSFHQIVAITHLPQIAGVADTHYVVEKTEISKRTMTSIRKLEIDERIREVAKLMSGAAITDAGLQSARELMNLK